MGATDLLHIPTLQNIQLLGHGWVSSVQILDLLHHLLFVATSFNGLEVGLGSHLVVLILLVQGFLFELCHHLTTYDSYELLVCKVSRCILELLIYLLARLVTETRQIEQVAEFFDV